MKIELRGRNVTTPPHLRLVIFTFKPASQEDLREWIGAVKPFTRRRRNCVVTTSSSPSSSLPEALNSNYVQILSTPPGDAKRISAEEGFASFESV